MKFIVKRDFLLKSLQQINNLLSNRQILPILGNLLLQVSDGILLITGTDLEVEMIASIKLCQSHESGSTTVSARKLFDICRALPEKAEILGKIEKGYMLVFSGNSYFSLSTLPAIDFPNLDNWQSLVKFTISPRIIKHLIDATQFSMAHQDVRSYLNGMLFETKGTNLNTVATDGHRLALCTMSIDIKLPDYSVIIPRKGIIALSRILNNNNNGQLHMHIGSNNIRVCIDNFTLTSKLINSDFPNYRQILTKNSNKILESNCSILKQALSRTAILSSDKFRTVRLCISGNQLKIIANNSEQEEAKETLVITYSGDDIEIGVNVNYILDVLNTLKCERVRILFTDPMSSIRIEDVMSNNSIYIIMPMRL